MDKQVLIALDKVNSEVDRLLSTSALVVRKFTSHLRGAKGKGIRALSVIVSALDENNDISDDAIRFAAAIEIFHLATLVHDDVMDDADSRRGIPTLHKLYGHKTAVITGDYLLALAMSYLNGIEDKNKYIDFNFSDILLDVAVGELNQHINNGNLNLSIKDYLEIIRGKTAKLFEASFYAGAITSVNDQVEIEKYKKLGDLVGMMFQINDDCIDFEFNEDEALKPVQSDFEQGVMTLPLLYSFEKDPESKNKNLDRSMINKLVKKFDGVGFAKRKSSKYYQESLDIIESLTLSELKYNCLIEVVKKAHNTI
ncbi:MAG: polyprenyl synthetase family protein [Erysipelothrix sp.]|nr:polyprenyl synthetase family protein [Erysipelothrix sp.]